MEGRELASEAADADGQSVLNTSYINVQGTVLTFYMCV